jgi:hypothetical protein
MDQKSIVRIVRRNEYFARNKDLEVFINGVHAGDVEPACHRDFRVPYGRVRVYVQMDWCRSKEKIVEMDEQRPFVSLDVNCPNEEKLLFISIFQKNNFFILSESR